MTIQLPTRKTSLPASTGLQALPVAPQPVRRVAMETQRLGAMLSGLGGEWADVADKVRRSAVRTEVGDEQIAYDEAKNIELDALNKDPDLLGRNDKFTTWHEDYIKTRSAGIKNIESSSYLSRWYKGQKSTIGTEIAANSWSASTKREFDVLEGQFAIAETTGNYNDVEIHAAEMIADNQMGAADFDNRLRDSMALRERIAHQQLYDITQEKLRAVMLNAGGGRSGKDAVDEWLADLSNTEGLPTKDIPKLKTDMTVQAAIIEIQADNEREAVTQEVISTMTGKLIKDEPITRKEVDLLEGEPEQKAWQNALDSQTKKPVKITDNSIKMDLQDKVLDYLLKTDPYLTEKEMYTQLVTAARTDRKITSEDLAELVEMMTSKYDTDRLALLKDGFGKIREQFSEGKVMAAAARRWPAPPVTNTGEALKEAVSQRAILARKAMADWLANRISRNKETTSADVYNKAIDLSVGGIIDTAIRQTEIDTKKKAEEDKEAKAPSKAPSGDRAYIGFTLQQNGTNIKWVWDGTKWQRAQ